MPAFAALLDGYRRFRAGPYNDQRERFDALAHAGQAPRVMVIACGDSRVDPTRIFDTTPGEMFVIRNIANLVPPHVDNGGAADGVAAAVAVRPSLSARSVLIFTAWANIASGLKPKCQSTARAM